MRALKEFKTMCRYTLFCTSAVPLPTEGNLPRIIKKAMKDAGSAKIIHLWCCLTLGQMDILQNSYLVFIASWGSGKTLLMFTKARELNELGEKILILVFLDGDSGLLRGTIWRLAICSQVSKSMFCIKKKHHGELWCLRL